MKATALKEQKVIFWSKHLDLANQYPDGILKYCEANGLASQTFYKWKLRLRSQVIKKPPTKRLIKNPFTEVHVCEPEVVRQHVLPDAKWLAQFILHLNEAAR
jgi:hypothetical protein